MAESTYHQMSVQHIRSLDQHRSPDPVRLVHQQQAQVIHHHQVGAQLQQHLAALVAIQDLERQRVWK